MSPDDPSVDDDPQFELLTLLRDEFAAGGIECGVSAAVGEVPAQLIVDVAGGNSVHICFLPDHDQPPVLQYLVRSTSISTARRPPTRHGSSHWSTRRCR